MLTGCHVDTKLEIFTKMIKNQIKNFIFVLILLNSVSLAKSEILILVHGWSANANTWIQSGVVANLAANGWENAGLVISLPNYQIKYIAAYGKNARKKVYQVDLPAEAPIAIQASHLLAEINFIHMLYPAETINIAGHSAGGIVARLAILQKNKLPISSLITIASPNLGTHRAVEALDLVHEKPVFCPGPGLEFVKTMFAGNNYNYIKYSQNVLIDLQPENNNNLLGWLNKQTHPNIKYHSIIRFKPGLSGDELVPGFSQDLNQVSSLRGKANSYFTQTGHSLNPADGTLLANILNNKT